MAKRRVSNLLALAVLATVSEGPAHPYQISTKLRTRGKESSIKINFGSLYSVVESLAKHGLIEAQETVREGKRPERTIYAITPAGRAELEDRGRALVDADEGVHLLRGGAVAGRGRGARRALPTADHTGSAVADGARLGRGGAGLHRGDGAAEGNVVEEQYRKAVMEAELAFVTTLGHQDRAATTSAASGGGARPSPPVAGAGGHVRGDREGPREVPRGGGGRTRDVPEELEKQKPPGRCGDTGPEGTSSSRPT